MGILAVWIHDVQDCHAGIIAWNEAIVPHRSENDLSVGQVGRREILCRTE
jgi:hypothetical protein